MICEHILLITLLIELELILCAQLNRFKYCCLIRIILYPINPLFSRSSIDIHDM